MTPGQTDIFDLVLEHSTAQWRHAALDAIRHLAATGRQFQAADVARIAGEPTHPNMWGACLRSAAHDGIITACGYAPSSRVTVAGSIVKLWRGTS